MRMWYRYLPSRNQIDILQPLDVSFTHLNPFAIRRISQLHSNKVLETLCRYQRSYCYSTDQFAPDSHARNRHASRILYGRRTRKGPGYVAIVRMAKYYCSSNTDGATRDPRWRLSAREQCDRAKSCRRLGRWYRAVEIKRGEWVELRGHTAETTPTGSARWTFFEGHSRQSRHFQGCLQNLSGVVANTNAKLHLRLTLVSCPSSPQSGMPERPGVYDE